MKDFIRINRPPLEATEVGEKNTKFSADRGRKICGLFIILPNIGAKLAFCKHGAKETGARFIPFQV